MSLGIGTNPQNVQTKSEPWYKLWTLGVNEVLVYVHQLSQMYHACGGYRQWGRLGGGEEWDRVIRRHCILSTQLCHEPYNCSKSKVYFLKKFYLKKWNFQLDSIFLSPAFLAVSSSRGQDDQSLQLAQDSPNVCLMFSVITNSISFYSQSVPIWMINYVATLCVDLSSSRPASFQLSGQEVEEVLVSQQFW